MTFEEWFEAEKQAERLYWADEEAARAGWEASAAQMAERLAKVADTAIGAQA